MSALKTVMMLHNLIFRVRQDEAQSTVIYTRDWEKTNFSAPSYFFEGGGAVGYLISLHDFVFCKDYNFLQSEKQNRKIKSS